MAEIIDFTSKITNELPVIKITDEIVLTVNNRKSVILNVQAMAQEIERKNKTTEYDQLKFMTKAMGMIVGEKNTAAIEELDLPMPEYTDLYQSIMSVASGQYGKDTPIK